MPQSQPQKNTAFRAARTAAGYSQQQLADELGVDVRAVGRWESSKPPWPKAPELRERLQELLGLDMASLGFAELDAGQGRSPRGFSESAVTGRFPVPRQRSTARQPGTVAEDVIAMVRAQRRLYWSVAPSDLHPVTLAHAALASALLPATTGSTRVNVASALAETYLLTGRIEFFDLRNPEQAEKTLHSALTAAGEADDVLLGAAVIAHMAFVPGWDGRREAAVDRMRAARTYARRGDVSALFSAWLNAVEAECETRCGNTRTALHLINQAEDELASGSPHPTPEWLDWFSPLRLAAFKGNTQLVAGHLPQARETLLAVLDQLPETEKQRTVILGDLAMVEATDGRPEEACAYASQALDQLENTWYATGMDRVKEVRKRLTPYQHQPCVLQLEDQLYAWSTTVSALAG